MEAIPFGNSICNINYKSSKITLKNNLKLLIPIGECQYTNTTLSIGFK